MKYTFLLLLVLTSCEGNLTKAEQVAKEYAEKTEQLLKQQAKEAADKVFPVFDAYTPDTKNNKERFKDFLKVAITPDVKKIYCFDDVMGIDADYMFAFECNTATSKKIIATNHLTLDNENADNGFGMQTDFDWWDKEKIQELPKYSWTDGDQYFNYYWYDQKHQKAYFFDFDL